jgi:Type IX secretion system membrane protein PorP/SprF
MNKFKKTNITLFIVFVFAITKISAQEFFQFYNIPQYYNSAFAGIEKCSNIVVSNNIHPVISGINFISNDLFLDTYVPKISGGLKFDVSRVSSPNNVFSSTNFAFAYAYHNKIYKKLRFSMSVQVKYNQESFKLSNLIFPNMITPYSNVLLPSNELVASRLFRSIIFGGGLVLYNNNLYFSGFVDNFYSIYINDEIITKTRLVLLTEKQLLKKKNNYVLKLNSAMIISKYFQNFSTGLIFQLKQVEIGLFSLQNFYNKSLVNGMNSYFAYNYNQLSIGYSHSFFTGNLYNKKSSTHEIHLKLRFNCREKKNNNTIICPAYKL